MKIIKFLFALIVLTVIAYVYNYIQISVFKVRKININSQKTKNDIKITQISDFHSNRLIDVNKLKNEIKLFDPDFIVLTGDIIDHKDRKLDIVMKMLNAISQLGKEIYFVQGNHEMRNSLYEDLKMEMKKLKITILEDTSGTITVNNEQINIIGLNFTPQSKGYKEAVKYEKATKKLNSSNYNLLLLHSPNNIENLINTNVDLVLSGHTHGGQVRMPFIGPIVAPGQGYFPKYDKGRFEIDNKTLYIDSGLGNSMAPLRAFNPVQFSNITIKGR